jgi:insulysin
MINHLIIPDINEEQFSGIKDRIIREYQNFHLSDAWRITRDQTERIFRNVYYSPDELYQNAAEISLKDISSFAGEIYQQAFIEGLVYGDYSKKEAKESLQILKQGLKNQAISKEAAFQVKYLQQTETEKIQAVQKIKVNNSCFWREYYLGVDDPVNRAISLIISGAIDRPFFTEMRTNQQLGYIVWSGTQRREDAQYLFFIIQSGVYPADELNKKANEYINQLPDLVSGLIPEMFEKYRQAAIDVLEKKPKSIFERAMKHKDIVFEFDADFERDQKTINALRGIEQSTVVNVLEVAIGEPSKKMVNSLGFAKDHMNESKLQSNYDDIKSWKKSRVYR